MKTIKLLETLANSPHYHTRIEALIAEQPEDIKKAFAAKDANQLRKSLSKDNRLANFSTVVQD